MGEEAKDAMLKEIKDKFTNGILKTFEENLKELEDDKKAKKEVESDLHKDYLGAKNEVMKYT